MCQKNKQLTDGQKLAKRLGAVVRTNNLAVDVACASLTPSDLERFNADDTKEQDADDVSEEVRGHSKEDRKEVKN